MPLNFIINNYHNSTKFSIIITIILLYNILIKTIFPIVEILLKNFYYPNLIRIVIELV